MQSVTQTVKVQNLSSTVCVFDQGSGESRPPEKSDISSDKQSVMKKNTIVSLPMQKAITPLF